MLDLFLKAADQAALYAALDSAGLMFTDDSGHRAPVQASQYPVALALAVYGAFSGKTGYHANLRLQAANATIQNALASVTISRPVNQLRDWS